MYQSRPNCQVLGLKVILALSTTHITNNKELIALDVLKYSVRILNQSWISKHSN